MGNMNLASAVLFEPRKAFTQIDARPSYGFPMLVVILSTVVIALWYRSVVDLEWVTDRALRASSFASQMSEAQIEEAVKRAASNRTLGTVATALGTPLAMLVIGLLGALYLMVAGRITRVRRGFRHWFAFTWWASAPGAVLSLLAAAFVLLTATTTQIDQAELKPLSLNALYLQKTIDQPGYSLFSNIDLIQLYTLWLTVVGVRTWSGRSWLFSAVFALLPYVLIFGTWAFISLR